jgi:hypothetical protein
MKAFGSCKGYWGMQKERAGAGKEEYERCRVGAADVGLRLGEC